MYIMYRDTSAELASATTGRVMLCRCTKRKNTETSLVQADNGKKTSS